MSTNNMNRFEFRSIRLEETQQAIEIEQICSRQMRHVPRKV